MDTTLDGVALDGDPNRLFLITFRSKYPDQ